MKCTNDVLSNACKHGTVFCAGSARAARIIGEISAKIRKKKNRNLKEKRITIELYKYETVKISDSKER